MPGCVYLRLGGKEKVCMYVGAAAAAAAGWLHEESLGTSCWANGNASFGRFVVVPWIFFFINCKLATHNLCNDSTARNPTPPERENLLDIHRIL